jgi:hypothetical protein
MIVFFSFRIILVCVKINCLFRECTFTRFRYLQLWHLLQWKFVYLLSAMWSDLRINYDPRNVLCLSFTDFYIDNLDHTALSWICNFVHFIWLFNLRCKGAVLSKLHTFCEFLRSSKYLFKLLRRFHSICLICILQFFQHLDFNK